MKEIFAVIGLCVFLGAIGVVFGPVIEQLIAPPPPPMPQAECYQVKANGSRWSVCTLPDGARCVVVTSESVSCYWPGQGGE